MNPANSITSQFRAGLAMLKGAIDACPEDLWTDGSYHNQFWHVAYHVLFYVHLYLSPSEDQFQPWVKWRSGYNFFPGTEWAPEELPATFDPYTKNDLLDYLRELHARVPEMVEAVPFEGPSGFSWIPFDRLQMHVYNIRHLGHHTGQLIDRVREKTGSGVGWVGIGRNDV